VVATSPNKIDAWAVYVDGNEVQPDKATSNVSSIITVGGTTGVFDVTLTAAGTGNHTIGVNTWDGDGTGTPKVYQIAVTIEPSLVPALPTSGVYPYLDVQEAPIGAIGPWNICQGTCAEGPGGPTSGTGAIQLKATVDDSVAGAQGSLSGSSMKETSTGASYDTLGYLHITPCPTTQCANLTNYLDDFWLYIPASDNGTLRALEFDPDLFIGGTTSTTFKMSMQCDSASGNWQFWNEKTGHWIPRDATSGDPTAPTYPCAMSTSQDQWKSGNWHHFQLYGQMNDETGGTYTYQTLVLDGEAVFQNLGLICDSSSAVSGVELNVEQQIDNETTAGTNSVYYDNYNFWVW
jgi:hypothetical protein